MLQGPQFCMRCCTCAYPLCAAQERGNDPRRVVRQALAEAVHAKQAPNEAVLAEERKKKNYVEFWAVISLKDPFRLVLSEMRDRLFHTREILHHCLVHPKCGCRTRHHTCHHPPATMTTPAVLPSQGSSFPLCAFGGVPHCFAVVQCMAQCAAHNARTCCLLPPPQLLVQPYCSAAYRGPSTVPEQ